MENIKVTHWWDFGRRLSVTTPKPTNMFGRNADIPLSMQDRMEGGYRAKQKRFYGHKNIKSELGNIPSSGYNLKDISHLLY